MVMHAQEPPVALDELLSHAAECFLQQACSSFHWLLLVDYRLYKTNNLCRSPSNVYMVVILRIPNYSFLQVRTDSGRQAGGLSSFGVTSEHGI